MAEKGTHVKTNKTQDYVLFACAIVIALMLLFPPFHWPLPGGGGANAGYGCLFVPTRSGYIVDIGMLLTQWAGVLIIGGILLLALRDKERMKSGVCVTEITERANTFEEMLKKYPELVELGADPSYVAYILAYTEHDKAGDTELMQSRGVADPEQMWDDWKRVSNIIEPHRKVFQKTLLLNFAGEAYRQRLEKNRLKEVLSKRARVEELPKKPPEWYLDRAILDLGSYFEAISPPRTKKAEERRQYDLIARLLYDFDLFKQEFSKAEDAAEEQEQAREIIMKRAEAIPAKIWKEHIQGVKESLLKPDPSASIE